MGEQHSLRVTESDRLVSQVGHVGRFDAWSRASGEATGRSLTELVNAGGAACNSTRRDDT